MDLSRAFVVPDLSSWLVWGEDVADLQRVIAPERAELMLTPARLPSGLVDAAREAWGLMPPSRRRESRPSPLGGVPIEDALADADAAHHDHTGHHEHDDHGGGHHDHHDMMAVVGDPSADGLVMEDIDFELGPLSASLPGGLVVDLSLDGDVVASARPRATLHVGRDELEGGAVPDALAPLSWRAALAAARRAPDEAERRRQLVAVEVERTLSHAAWLQALGHTIGWGRLAADALALARALLPARAAAVGAELDPDALRAAAVRADDLHRLIGGRMARRRLRGLAPADADSVRSRGIGGPVARAAGVDADPRSADPLYAELGFEPVVAQAGDADARAAVRAAELRASLDLAAAAAREGAADRAATGPRWPADFSGARAVVEGPRGPLHANVDPAGVLHVAAPGAAALLELAGEAVADLELGAAIAGLVSFDLSPWRVGR